jgi:hypothetical protein
MGKNPMKMNLKNKKINEKNIIFAYRKVLIYAIFLMIVFQLEI